MDDVLQENNNELAAKLGGLAFKDEDQKLAIIDKVSTFQIVKNMKI